MSKNENGKDDQIVKGLGLDANAYRKVFNPSGKPAEQVVDDLSTYDPNTTTSPEMGTALDKLNGKGPAEQPMSAAERKAFLDKTTVKLRPPGK